MNEIVERPGESKKIIVEAVFVLLYSLLGIALWLGYIDWHTLIYVTIVITTL
jgi:hypothetical protein